MDEISSDGFFNGTLHDMINNTNVISDTENYNNEQISTPDEVESEHNSNDFLGNIRNPRVITTTPLVKPQPRSISWKPRLRDDTKTGNHMYPKVAVTIPSSGSGHPNYTLRINDFLTFLSERGFLYYGMIIDMYYDGISKCGKIRIRICTTAKNVLMLREDFTLERNGLPVLLITDRVMVIKTPRQIKSMRPLIVDTDGIDHKLNATVWFVDQEYASFIPSETDEISDFVNCPESRDKYHYITRWDEAFLADNYFTTIPPYAILRHEIGYDERRKKKSVGQKKCKLNETQCYNNPPLQNIYGENMIRRKRGRPPGSKGLKNRGRPQKILCLNNQKIQMITETHDCNSCEYLLTPEEKSYKATIRLERSIKKLVALLKQTKYANLLE